MVDIIFTKKTLCICSPKSCLFCGLNLVGLLCLFFILLFSQYLPPSRSKDGYSCIARETCDEALGGGNLAMDLLFLYGVVIMLLFSSCCENWDGLHFMGHLAQLQTWAWLTHSFSLLLLLQGCIPLSLLPLLFTLFHYCACIKLSLQ